MNQDNNDLNQQNNNGIFNNLNQQNQNILQDNNFNQPNYQNTSNIYQSNQNITQDGSLNQSIDNSNVQNNNIYQQPINENNIFNDNQKNSKKHNKFKIIGIIIAIVLILLIGIFMFGRGNTNQLKGGTTNGATIDTGQELKIKSNFVDITLKVESVERNVKLLNLFDEEETFTKIKISIVNNDKEDEFSSAILVAYELFDENKKEIEDGGCYDETWIGLYKGENLNALPTEIPANSSDSGYLYCIDNDALGSILGITSFTDFDEELMKEGTIKSTAKEEFFVNLR